MNLFQSVQLLSFHTFININTPLLLKSILEGILEAEISFLAFIFDTIDE